MSYTCEKVNTVSSEIAESFWTAGESYYLTERTLPKYTGSDTDNYNNFIKVLTVSGTLEALYVVSLNDYPVVIIPSTSDGDKTISDMIFIRPDATNSRAFLYDANGHWYSFVNFWKTEGYHTMHGPVVYESSLYNYFKYSCENNLCPTSFSSVPYDDFNSYLPMLAEGSKQYHWATFIFNE